MLVDANLLLFAANGSSPFHTAALSWLVERLNGSQRVGLPWQTLGAFLRVSTHPRGFDQPLTPTAAWRQVHEWLDSELAWIPLPGPRHAEILGELITRHQLAGNLIPDAQLAALALEHGLAICSADTDFARFPELRWENPVA